LVFCIHLGTYATSSVDVDLSSKPEPSTPPWSGSACHLLLLPFPFLRTKAGGGRLVADTGMYPMEGTSPKDGLWKASPLGARKLAQRVGV